jgi:hypothetical protein
MRTSVGSNGFLKCKNVSENEPPYATRHHAWKTFSVWTQFTVSTGKRSELPRGMPLVTRVFASSEHAWDPMASSSVNFCRKTGTVPSWNGWFTNSHGDHLAKPAMKRNEPSDGGMQGEPCDGRNPPGGGSESKSGGHTSQFRSASDQVCVHQEILLNYCHCSIARYHPHRDIRA